MKAQLKERYAINDEQKAAVRNMGGNAFNGTFTAKERRILGEISRKWPERWWRGHKAMYFEWWRIASQLIAMEGKDISQVLTMIAETSNPSHCHRALALCEAVEFK